MNAFIAMIWIFNAMTGVPMGTTHSVDVMDRATCERFISDEDAIAMEIAPQLSDDFNIVVKCVPAPGDPA